MRLVLTTLLLCAVAQAATSNATLSINATVAISSTAFTATGTTTLTGALVASGTFSATIPLSSLTSSTVSAPFTITTSAGTLGGTLLIPLSVLAGTATSGTGSGTITIATGSYAGDTGSFPSLAGSGSVSATGAVTITISGTGTITTGGTVTAPPPAITGVYDDASNTSTVAQGLSLIHIYQPVNSQELWAIERLALAQQALDRCSRAEVGMYTACLNLSLIHI